MRALVFVLALASCADEPRVVPLLRTAGAPMTIAPPAGAALALSTRATSVADPLPVLGSSIAFADVEPALASAIGSAVAPWAAADGKGHVQKYAMLVELTQAEVRHTGGRLQVHLGVRATLKNRDDNGYVAQTHAYCQEAGLVPPDRGAPVLYACMAQIGRELSGWLGGID